jgi:hypothetical protein
MTGKTIQFDYEQASMEDEDPIHRPISSHQNPYEHLLPNYSERPHKLHARQTRRPQHRRFAT